jgi:hypothetical protein
MLKYIPSLAWAWIIIVGGLMIYPGGIECIACGRIGSKIAGVISIALGVLGFLSGRASSAPVAGKSVG